MSNEFVVTTENAGERLDRWLTDALPGRSRNEVQRWIKEGAVTVDGEAVKPKLALEVGQRVQVTVPGVAESSMVAQAIELTIL